MFNKFVWYMLLYVIVLRVLFAKMVKLYVANFHCKSPWAKYEQIVVKHHLNQYVNQQESSKVCDHAVVLIVVIGSSKLILLISDQFSNSYSVFVLFNEPGLSKDIRCHV